MAVCPLCRTRKGKRACPALRGTICSVCCGTKRIVEIACPADCVYLQAGTNNDVRREAVDYLKHEDPRKGMRWLRTVEHLGFLLEVIERAIASAPLPSLEDSDLLVALRCAWKTFDTESKGVIYEDLPSSPSVQALTRDLVSAVRLVNEGLEEKRRSLDLGGGGAALPSWGPAEAAHCFDVLAERCEYHVRRKEEAGSFIAHLRRVHPPSPGELGSARAPRIILT